MKPNEEQNEAQCEQDRREQVVGLASALVATLLTLDANSCEIPLVFENKRFTVCVYNDHTAGMTLNEYQALALRTAPAPGANHFFSFAAALPQAEAAFRPNVDLIHAAFGMAGESGELVDMVKKSMFYGKPLKPSDAIKEAGDCLWYIAGPFCRAFGITLEQLAALNVAKLTARYPDKYSDQAAVERKDVEGAN